MKQRIIQRTLFTAFGGLVVLGLFSVISQSNYLFFHCLAQTISIAVSWAVFVVAWNSRHVAHNNAILLLGIGFLFSSGLDFLHTLAFPGMGVFPGYGPNLPHSLWLGARFIQTGALLLAPLFVRREYNLVVAFGGFALVTIAIATAIFSGTFPLCWTSPQGATSLRIFGELALAAGTLLASIKFYSERKNFSRPVLGMLMAYIAFTAAQEVCFAFGTFSGNSFTLAGYLLKLLAAYYLYHAVVAIGIARPQEVLYWQLKQSEEALRLSRERFKTVADFTFDWEYWLDENGECLWVSPSAKRITGYDANEFYNAPSLFTTIMHPEDRHTIRDLSSHKQQRTSVCKKNFRIIRKDGVLRWVGHICQPVYDSSGQWRGRRGSNRDITEVLKAERLRKDVERIARHDIKSPLGSIISALGTLCDMNSIPQQNRQLLEEMQTEARNALTMVDMSLILLKIEENCYKPNSGPQDAIKIIRAATNALTPLMRSKDVQVQVQIDEQAEDTIFVGEKLLTQSLLTNLIKNAIEASPEHKVVRVRLAGPLSTCIITITNEGEVPAVMREKFFCKYATHGKQKGMGLGTYSARLLAQVQGGDVGLVTEEAGKTTLTVSLPRHRPS